MIITFVVNIRRLRQVRVYRCYRMHHDLQFAFKTVSNWSLFRLVYITLTTITSALYISHASQKLIIWRLNQLLARFFVDIHVRPFPLFSLSLIMENKTPSLMMKKKEEKIDFWRILRRVETSNRMNELVSRISKMVEPGEIDWTVHDFSITDRRFPAIDSLKRRFTNLVGTRPQTIKAFERTSEFPPNRIHWSSLYLTPLELIRKTFRLEAHWFAKHRPIRLRRTELVCLQLQRTFLPLFSSFTLFRPPKFLMQRDSRVSEC